MADKNESKVAAPVGGVGVLAVMDEVVRHMDATMPTPLGRRGESHRHPVHHAGMAFDLRQARAAVAELVAADLAFDEAVAAHGISSRWAVEANERRAAALAPFQTGGAE